MENYSSSLPSLYLFSQTILSVVCHCFKHVSPVNSQKPHTQIIPADNEFVSPCERRIVYSFVTTQSTALFSSFILWMGARVWLPIYSHGDICRLPFVHIQGNFIITLKPITSTDTPNEQNKQVWPLHRCQFELAVAIWNNRRMANSSK